MIIGSHTWLFFFKYSGEIPQKEKWHKTAFLAAKSDFETLIFAKRFDSGLFHEYRSDWDTSSGRRIQTKLCVERDTDYRILVATGSFQDSLVCSQSYPLYLRRRKIRQCKIGSKRAKEMGASVYCLKSPQVSDVLEESFAMWILEQVLNRSCGETHWTVIARLSEL